MHIHMHTHIYLTWATARPPGRRRHQRHQHGGPARRAAAQRPRAPRRAVRVKVTPRKCPPPLAGPEHAAGARGLRQLHSSDLAEDGLFWVRETLVPGAYTLDVTHGEASASVGFDVEPGRVTDVFVELD